MKRIIWIVIFVALVATLFNDGGKWFNARSSLRDSTNALSSWASLNARRLPKTQVARELETQAAQRGIRVYQYAQDATSLQIWTETDVVGTWVVGPYIAVTRGIPLRQSRGVPFTVRDYVQAQFQ